VATRSNPTRAWSRDSRRRALANAVPDYRQVKPAIVGTNTCPARLHAGLHPGLPRSEDDLPIACPQARPELIGLVSEDLGGRQVRKQADLYKCFLPKRASCPLRFCQGASDGLANRFKVSVLLRLIWVLAWMKNRSRMDVHDVALLANHKRRTGSMAVTSVHPPRV